MRGNKYILCFCAKFLFLTQTETRKEKREIEWLDCAKQEFDLFASILPFLYVVLLSSVFGFLCHCRHCFVYLLVLFLVVCIVLCNFFANIFISTSSVDVRLFVSLLYSVRFMRRFVSPDSFTMKVSTNTELKESQRKTTTLMRDEANGFSFSYFYDTATHVHRFKSDVSFFTFLILFAEAVFIVCSSFLSFFFCLFRALSHSFPISLIFLLANITAIVSSTISFYFFSNLLSVFASLPSLQH